MCVVVVSQVDVVAHGLVSILASQDVEVAVVHDHAAAVARGASVLVYDVSSGSSRRLAGIGDVAALGIPVVVVVAEQRPAMLAETALHHRFAVVSVSMPAEGIVAAVAAAASGRVHPSAIPVSDAPGLMLSAREAQVLALIGRGLSNQEIAAHLYLSINSVKTYVRTLYRKIGVVRRSQAVVWATRHGFAGELSETAAYPQRAH
jgi:DNA-binding NarL/FixJ family response regulator